jgi:hypothetical protein
MMVANTPYSRWGFCLLLVLFLFIPQNSMAIKILEKDGVIYYCSKVALGRCYQCGGGEPINVGDGSLESLPGTQCPDDDGSTTTGELESEDENYQQSTRKASSKGSSDSKDTDIKKTGEKDTQRSTPRAKSKAAADTKDPGKKQPKKK